MKVFLIACMPVILCWFLVQNKKFSASSFIPPILFGVISSTVICLFKEFFVFSTFTITDNSVVFFLHSWCSQILLPCVALTAVFFLFSKDSAEYKIEALFPLLSSFYAIFLPYITLTGDDFRNSYMLFLRPIIYVCLLIMIKYSADNFMNRIKSGNKTAALLISLVIIAETSIPQFIENFWYYSSEIWLPVIAAVIIGAAVIFIYILKLIKFNKTEINSAN